MAHQHQFTPPTHKKLLPDGTPPYPLGLPKAGRASSGRQILRVNQACRTCRRQKMRCEGPESPPCARCRASGIECVFEKVGKGDIEQLGDSSSDRMQELEKRVETIALTQMGMQDTLKEILSELRNRSRSTASPLPTPSSTADQCPEDGSSTVASLKLGDTDSTDVKPLAGPSGLGLGSITAAHVESASQTVPVQYDRHIPFTVESSMPQTWAGTSDHAQLTSAVSYLPSQQDVTDGLRYDLPLATRRERSEDGQPPPKRRRIDIRSLLLDDDQWSTPPTQDDAQPSSANPDVIGKGALTDNEARDLWNLYFEKCHRFLPIFDTRIDTYESMRERSSLCFCCILMVASKARDGAQEPSPLQKLLWKEAIEGAKDVLLVGGESLERVQAMLLISAWSHSSGGTGWLATGHAIRFAVDMGLHRAIPRLAKRIQERCADDPEGDQLLMTAARLWCALYVFEYQICLGTGRPPMILGVSTLRGSQEVFFQHRLAQPTDARFVAGAELYSLVKDTLEAIRALEETDVSQRAYNIVHDACTRIDEWHKRWNGMIRSKGSEPEVLLHTIRVQRSFAYLSVHARLMVSLRTIEDVNNISPLLRAISLQAVAAAKEIVQICVENADYAEELRYSITHSRSSFGFAGLFLLRMTRLFIPDPREIKQVIELLRQLVDVLSRSPIGAFVTRLRALVGSHSQAIVASVPLQLPAQYVHCPGPEQPSDSSGDNTVQDAQSVANAGQSSPAVYLQQPATPNLLAYSGWSLPHLQQTGDVPKPADFVEAEFASDL